MAKELTSTVSVHHDDGSYTTYEPGDDIPAEDAKKITNPAAWGDEDEDYGEEDTWTPASSDPPPMGEDAAKAPAKKTSASK